MLTRYITLFTLLLALLSCDKNEVINQDSSGNTNVLLKGTGSLIFDSYQPQADKPISIFYHIPENANESTPILFVFHGGNRDAEQSRNYLIEKANRNSTILIVPEFSSSYFPGGDAYNLGNVFEDGDSPSAETRLPESEWTFSLVEPMFDYMKKVTANETNTYNALGYSAGAQFLHRFLIFKPASRVDLAVCAAAGWYTMPNYQTDFPYGLNQSQVAQSNLSSLFSQNIRILVGEADNNPNAPSLRRNQVVDQQGTNRLARAQYFYSESKQEANQMEYTFNWQYRSITNVSHDFQALANYTLDNILRN